MSDVQYSRSPAFFIGLAFIAFQLWIVINPQQALFERPIHLSFALVLLFLYRPLTNQYLPLWMCRSIDLICILGALGVSLYYVLAFDRLTTRMENVSPVLTVDMVVGVGLVLLLLEGARRAVGWVLVAVLGTFIAYAFLGALLPGWLSFRGFPLDAAIEITTMTTAGVLGITTSTSVGFIFYFILFGAFYSAVGGGQLFIDLAIRAAGRTTGGTAKAAVISSSLMGSISGSAVANVVSTGVLTIPLMIRTGLPAHRAAAIEAISSTGGQLMPPVMGVAAFIMAEMLNVPYLEIALAGLIPALAFYFALFLIVDLSARREGIRALNDAEIEAIPPLTPRLHLLLPPLVLIATLLSGQSAPYAALIASASCLIAPFIRRATWIGPKELLSGLLDAPRQAAEVAVPIAAIGLVIAVAVQSNLALKFAGSLVGLAEGSMLLSLGLAIMGCIIMGMGLPTVAAYIIGAVLFVPALQELGISPLSAHFFIFYYCVLSMITPPVALASFAAAAVGKAPVMATSWSAFGLSLAAFFIPLGFVFDPAILWIGSLDSILISGLGLMCATTLWGIALGGWFWGRLPIISRLMIGAAAVIGMAAPFGSLWWFLTMGTGFAIAIFSLVVARLTASTVIEHRP
jgi:TRAP transporter 4TM/12TM fusion protein